MLSRLPYAIEHPDGTLTLYNVRDTRAFVADKLHKSRLRLSRDEREELICEGVAIMCELANRYEPHRDGYEQAGTFSGFAGYFLPRKLQDAYYRMHPEHRTVRDEDGTKRREFGHAALSLEYDDLPEPVATCYLGPSPYDQAPAGTASARYEPPPTVASALSRLPVAKRMYAHKVVQHIDEGYTPDEIARRLVLNRGQVAHYQACVASAIHLCLKEATA